MAVASCTLFTPNTFHMHTPCRNKQHPRTLCPGYWLRFHVPLDAKQVTSETFPKPTAWLSTEKLNPNTTKHRFTNQKKCNKTQNKHKKAKVTSYSIRDGNGDGLFWFWRFINLSLTYLLTYLLKTLTHLLTAPDSHRSKTLHSNNCKPRPTKLNFTGTERHLFQITPQFHKNPPQHYNF